MTPDECNLTHKPFDAADPDTPEALREAHHAALENRGLPIWCVTFNPSDLPGLYVARLQVSLASGVYVTTIAVTGASIDDVRRVLPPGLICFDRAPDDEAQIVETWL